MAKDDQPTHKHAFEIAGDPDATEARWMAAVTLLDNARHELKLPGCVAMPWAMMLGSVGAAGGFLLFSSLQLVLCTKLGELSGDALMASYIAMAFGIWFVPCVVFSMLFTYQRLMNGGGRTWVLTQWILLAGYLATISFWAIDGQPVKPWDGALLVVWNLSCMGLGLLGTKVAEKTFNSLNETIGAGRILSRMQWCFASIPFLMLGFAITGLMTSFFLPFNYLFFVLSGTVIVASYMVSRSLGATATGTGSAIASIVWAPFILTNVVLFPVMGATQVWLSLTGGPYFVSWIDYVGALGTLGVSVLAPVAGGALASKHLQAQAALGLERGDRRNVLTQSETCGLSMTQTAAVPAPVTDQVESG